MGGRWGCWEQVPKLSRKWSPSPPPSLLVTHPWQVGVGKRSLPRSSGGWLYPSSSAFLFFSPPLFVRSSGPPLHDPTTADTKGLFPPPPQPLTLFPRAYPASLPVETLLLPRAPPQTPPPPEGLHPQVCQTCQGALGEH